MPTPVAYPAGLPGVSSYRFVPRERRAVSDGAGLPGLRTRARDPIVDAVASWRYTPEEAEVWEEWHRTTLLRGQLWFSAELPGAGGYVQRVARYVGPARARHLSAGIYEVTAPLEVRPIPPEIVYVLSTTLYPVEAIEYLDMAQGELLASQFLQWEVAELDMAQGELTAAELREPIVIYDDWPAEAMDIEQGELTASQLRNPIIVYDDWPPEPMDIAQGELTAGNLRVGLITYADWPPEGMDIAQGEITGSTLT